MSSMLLNHSSMSYRGGGDREVHLFPRRKVGQQVIPHKGRRPLVIDFSVLQSLFDIPQLQASKRLGISLTAMKQLCRKLGVSRWPYQKPGKKGKTIRRKSQQLSPAALGETNSLPVAEQPVQSLVSKIENGSAAQQNESLTPEVEIKKDEETLPTMQEDNIACMLGVNSVDDSADDDDSNYLSSSSLSEYENDVLPQMEIRPDQLACAECLPLEPDWIAWYMAHDGNVSIYPPFEAFCGL
ncbi:hypothetical protein GUITHDRAFT_100635 [Guillardia theta CCMP2712]|uniref:RWP-RK domain-containing protein n=1 Tax=Guillardia theta (strain CCMP2712) TaxID=905079 RepID=L1JZ54_GUITC|nr:hypothetical protein GUITHDRAFT_100635 [Guillardia theta CCMP2712]EKX53657.1 hypothetical protein GUITHDRAFT_100635 [Guillardia theta CCMP2712]|eukprot:XP_005840637.1 hypothetical protein GUITHDRAFT_100635 [Guillardia theta CCMP2712]